MFIFLFLTCTCGSIVTIFNFCGVEVEVPLEIERSQETNREMYNAWRISQQTAHCRDKMLNVHVLSTRGLFGPDSFGYFADDTDSSVFSSISSATGTLAYTLSTCAGGNFAFRIQFYFYGTLYNNVQVSSNGFASFGAVFVGCCGGVAIPNAATPNAFIAGWWDDLDPSRVTGGDIYYLSTGTSPNRLFIVEFNSVASVDSTTGQSSTFQIVLYENWNIRFMV